MKDSGEEEREGGVRQGNVGNRWEWEEDSSGHTAEEAWKPGELETDGVSRRAGYQSGLAEPLSPGTRMTRMWNGSLLAPSSTCPTSEKA